MDYYSQKQYIARVDTDDNILGKVEKWEAHEKGILHRAFSVAIFYQDQVILQHRKHPVFDKVLDITVSSHQIFHGESLEDDLEGVYSTLKREFLVDKNNLLSAPRFTGKAYYKAPDSRSKFIEHEVVHMYACIVKTLPLPDLAYAYGYSLTPLSDIKDPSNFLYPLLAPWVIACFQQGVL